MESRRKRKSSQIFKWVCYTLLMLLCTVLQTMPGLFQLGAAKPLYLLPLALAVSVFEGEFAGAVFGAVCGLMWDYTAETAKLRIISSSASIPTVRPAV